jgi:predicted secreted hydrolase
MTDVNISLTYDEYKHFEKQLRNYQAHEAAQTTLDGRYYHKYFRLEIGNLRLEVQGPLVRQPQTPYTVKAKLGEGRPA